MKVSELIAKLKSEAPEAVVVVEKDREGNTFEDLVQVEKASYQKEANTIGLASEKGARAVVLRAKPAPKQAAVKDEQPTEEDTKPPQTPEAE